MAAASLAREVGVAPACRALGVARATFYRRRKPTTGHQQPRQRPARALDESERENGRLKRAVADLTLDKLIVEEAAKGNF